MRKLSLLLVFAVLAISSAFAQTPEQFKYQAVLRNADGDIMASETVNVNIKILQGAADGTEVFSEDHLNINTSAQGLININIGDTEDLSTIDWANDTYFIKISVNGAELGTSQLLSVPYALNAKTAENVVGNVQVGHHANALPMKEVIMLTGTTDGAGTVCNISLPSGFNEDNCVAFSTTIYTDDGYIPSWNAQNVSHDIVGSSFYLRYPDSSDYQDKPYRIVLVKF